MIQQGEVLTVPDLGAKGDDSPGTTIPLELFGKPILLPGRLDVHIPVHNELPHEADFILSNSPKFDLLGAIEPINTVPHVVVSCGGYKPIFPISLGEITEQSSDFTLDDLCASDFIDLRIHFYGMSGNWSRICTGRLTKDLLKPVHRYLQAKTTATAIADYPMADKSSPSSAERTFSLTKGPLEEKDDPTSYSIRFKRYLGMLASSLPVSRGEIESSTLNLSWVPLPLRDYANTAASEGDYATLFALAGENHAWKCFVENMLFFHSRGVLESMLLEAYSTSFLGIPFVPLQDMYTLLNLCNVQQLHVMGDPIPKGTRFTLYRGVSGLEPYRHERGISWTRTIGNAASFPYLRERCDITFDDPAILKTTVKRNEVFAYMNQSYRYEDEFLIIPKRITRLEFTRLQIWRMAEECKRRHGRYGND